MTNTYCLILNDPVPDGFVDALERRFGDGRIARGRCHTRVECQLKDEAALRGLLTPAWDAGRWQSHVSRRSQDRRRLVPGEAEVVSPYLRQLPASPWPRQGQGRVSAARHHQLDRGRPIAQQELDTLVNTRAR